jgi:DNA modification methylase
MIQLLRHGYTPRLRPSGHDISDKFQNDRGGAIPPNIFTDNTDGTDIGKVVHVRATDVALPVNVISASNTSSNDIYQKRCKEAGIKPHPARFPEALPMFAINLCTEPGDLVLDPFAGSNVTGKVAEDLQRRWIAIELEETYLRGSQFRFTANLLQAQPDDEPPDEYQARFAV